MAFDTIEDAFRMFHPVTCFDIILHSHWITTMPLISISQILMQKKKKIAADNFFTGRDQKKFSRTGSHMYWQWQLCRDWGLANSDCKRLPFIRHTMFSKMLKSERNVHLRILGIWYYHQRVWRELICVAWIRGFKKQCEHLYIFSGFTCLTWSK